MKRPASLTLGLSLLAFCALTGRCVSTQVAGETWDFANPVITKDCQSTGGPKAQDTYTIGVTTGLTQVGEPITVFDVTPGGPASIAGIQKGDLLWGTDSNNSPSLIDSCEVVRKELSGPKEFVLYHQSPGQHERVRTVILPKLRRDVYPAESQMSWRIISEYVEGGQFRASCALARGSSGDFELRLGIYNSQTANLLQLDESKIFLLDDQGREFSHQTFTEWKQSLENLIAQFNALAQGMESVPLSAPPQPLPPTRYHISSSVDGTYTLTPMGVDAYQVNGRAQVESTVSPEYTTNEQIGQAARSLAYVIEAIRAAHTNKEIKKLRQRAAADGAAAEKLLVAGTGSHLETTAPIAPGARRTGAVAFVQPKDSNPSTVSAIFVVTNPSTKKEWFLTFTFQL
jgi:hypothetical protein